MKIPFNVRETKRNMKKKKARAREREREREGERGNKANSNRDGCNLVRLTCFGQNLTACGHKTINNVQ